MKKIYLCRECDRYTLRRECPRCGKKSILPRPPKWSPEDKYGKYRRYAKKIICSDQDL